MEGASERSPSNGSPGSVPHRRRAPRRRMIKVREVEARAGYRVWIRFEDGTEGEVDLSHLVGRGVFRLWEDCTEFEKVYVEPVMGAVAWSDDLDLCPDALYQQLTGMLPWERYPDRF